MTTVIGGDLALRQTGLAIWSDGVVRLRTITTAPEDGDKPVRWAHIVRECAAEVRPRSLFVYERGYHRVGFGAVSLDLASVRAVVLLRMYAESVPYVGITPQAIKLLATGSGSAKKPAMMTAAREVLRLRPRTQDEADAAWLMAAGLTRFPEGRAWLAARGVDTGRPWATNIDWSTASWAGPVQEVPHGTGGREGAGDGREAAAG